MYYRVKRFSEEYVNMQVLDKDMSLAALKLRTTIEDCAGTGPKSFDNPQFIESQEIICVSDGGKKKKSDIIRI